MPTPEKIVEDKSKTPSPENIVEDKNTILSQQEKKQLKEYMKKNPTEIQKQAILSLENNFKIKDLINTKTPAEMNREEIAVLQLYANLKGGKIVIDGVYWPKTTGAINTLQLKNEKSIATKPNMLLTNGENNSQQPTPFLTIPWTVDFGKNTVNKAPIVKNIVPPVKNVPPVKKEVVVKEKKTIPVVKKEVVKEKSVIPTIQEKDKIKMVTDVIQEKTVMPTPKEKITILDRKVDLSHINNPIDMTIAYLWHQQWRGWLESILKNIVYGTPLSSKIRSHLPGNVGGDWQKYAWTSRKNLNAKTFFWYRHNKLSDNLQTQWYKKTVFENAAEKVAKETGISLPLLKAIVFTESWNVVHNDVGQYKWLMALWKDARSENWVKNPFDPYQNMLWWAKLISKNTKGLEWLSNIIKTQWLAKILWPDISGNV